MSANSNINTGLYTLNELTSRAVIKLAPDAFVTFSGSTDVRIAMANNNSTTMDMKAGLTSISAVTDNTPGGGRCTITMVCPQYDSLNQTYYLTQPDGTKTPFFVAMMEVRVFAKGRFLAKDGTPSYYPIFWGYIRAVNETYTGSETSFSLSCVNMLAWWERQIVNLNLVAGQQAYGGGGFQPQAFSFRQMNPWEIILNLFYDTSFNNFMYPSTIGEDGNAIPTLLDNFFAEPNFGGAGGYRSIATSVTDSWRDRYGFGRVLASDTAKASGVSNIEMYGMSKVIKISDKENSPFTLEERVKSADQGGLTKATRFQAKEDGSNITNKPGYVAYKDDNSAKSLKQVNTGDYVIRAINPHVADDSPADLDFGILGKVMPYGDWSTNAVNATVPHRKSKLEIAAEVSKAIGFEFFQDTNGMFVFKPPFYNMDTSRSKIYHIKQADIIHFDEAVDAGLIVTWIRASGARLQQNSVAIEGTHFDVGLMRQFGLKEQVLKLPFGFSAEVVRAQAACEMSKANAKAFSASLTIPMRPEIRVGYPVYIEHIDAYYYVKQVSHALTFGGNAVTSLTLEAKRAKVRDDKGKVLKGYIYEAFRANKKVDRNGVGQEAKRSASIDLLKTQLTSAVASNKSAFINSQDEKSVDANGKDTYKTNYFGQGPTPSETYMRNHGLISSPTPGSYEAVPLASYTSVTTSSADAASVKLGKISGVNGSLSKLVLYTLDTTPYTDVNGYQHIGGFPYGATLVLGDDATIQDAPSDNAGMMTSIRPEGAINPSKNPLGYPSSQRAQFAAKLDDGTYPAKGGNKAVGPAKPTDATNVSIVGFSDRGLQAANTGADKVTPIVPQQY